MEWGAPAPGPASHAQSGEDGSGASDASGSVFFADPRAPRSRATPEKAGGSGRKDKQKALRFDQLVDHPPSDLEVDEGVLPTATPTHKRSLAGPGTPLDTLVKGGEAEEGVSGEPGTTNWHVTDNTRKFEGTLLVGRTRTESWSEDTDHSEMETDMEIVDDYVASDRTSSPPSPSREPPEEAEVDPPQESDADPSERVDEASDMSFSDVYPLTQGGGSPHYSREDQNPVDR